MDRETLLGELASAILEGRAIDWTSVESTAGSEHSALIQQLKVVAEIATLHRDGPDPAGALSSWGHLRLLERVGSGTFGDVYRAWDPHLDREVALKLLRATPAAAALDASLSDPARVVNEGRLLARVRHPHVITVYGAEPREGTVGVWMEFIRGKTLHQIVTEQGPMSAREATAVATDLCGALAAVHAAGLLHRDVTARNVMRADGGRIVLMDFGAGHEGARRIVNDDGRDMAGTPLYMAPELFSGARADQRTDIYALGALLYYLVSAKFPVTGRSLSEVGAAHQRRERQRLRDARPDLPAGFVRVVEKALEADPAHRFQTVGELERALEDPTGAFHGSQSPATRHRGVYLAAALSLALVIAAALTWLSSSGANNQTGQPDRPSTVSVGTGLTTQKLAPTGDVWAFSNPTDDGRYMLGMVGQTGDAALIEVATGQYRALGMGRGDYSDGYASLGIISPDGRLAAVEWWHENAGRLRLIGTDGSEPRDVLTGASDFRAYQFSRDGSLILAAVRIDRDTNAVSLIAVSDGAVRRVRTIGSAFPYRMALSPDGRYIAYDYLESADTLDRNIYVIDTHTGEQWPLVVSPGEDREPLWTPDGRSLVFLSDRSRSLSLWMVPMTKGRAGEEPRLLRDDLGRSWLSGFTASGRLFYVLASGHAEVHLASLDSARIEPTVISPRLALSNFYPEWSQDGRYVAYSSERSARGRELWVHDTQSKQDYRVTADNLGVGRPFAWSPDGSTILTRGTQEQQLYLVNRYTGAVDILAENALQPGWGPAGILYRTGRQAALYDPRLRRVTRTFDFRDPAFAGFNVSWDGRSVLSVKKDGVFSLDEAATTRRLSWPDPGAVSVGNHFMAPVGAGVAYVATRTTANGPVRTLSFWRGGSPRELLRAASPEEFILAGWHGDGRRVLVVRWTARPETRLRKETLWLVPIDGGTPTNTGLTMEGLRDVSIHPDGRRIAFNAGWKMNEHWVMDNLLPQ